MSVAGEGEGAGRFQAVTEGPVCTKRNDQPATAAAQEAGVEFVNISPLRSDLLDRVGADWLAIRPNTDVALMLALAHVLISEDLYDRDFLDRYTVGFDRFAGYLSGETDGLAKTPEWAAEICELSAETIRALARRMARSRTMISVAWALTPLLSCAS